MSKITIDTETIEDEVRSQVVKHISDKLGYSRTLHDMVDNVLTKHQDEIENTIDEALATVIGDKKFKATIIEEFQHKVAKNLVGKLEGTVEKAVETYRQNPTLKSKMILAIENIIKEAEL